MRRLITYNRVVALSVTDLAKRHQRLAWETEILRQRNQSLEQEEGSNHGWRPPRSVCSVKFRTHAEVHAHEDLHHPKKVVAADHRYDEDGELAEQ